MTFNFRRSLQALTAWLACCVGSAAAIAPAPALQAAGTAIPRYDHVVVVMEENTSETSIYGSANAPYINSLKDNGVYFTQSFAITHPSQPNYVALFSGSTQGLSDDSCPHTFSANNLGNQLRTAGFSFIGYSESMPSDGYTGCTSGTYARKHSPWIDFSDLPVATNLTYASFPTDFTTLPTLSFVIPNLCDDMHDCSTVTGDTWLKNHLDAYAQWAKTHNSLLIVTWDEDDSTTSANQIATIFYGANLKNGAYGETVNHYSILRTLEDMYGLTALGSAANATAITDVWASATPDFGLSASPTSLSVNQGASVGDTITATSINGFAGAVNLSVSGLPSGVTATFAPTSVSPPANGSASSTLTLTASSTAATGSATVTVTGSNGTLTHSATVTLAVNPAPDFSLSASPQNLTIPLGQSGNDTITVASLAGFSSAVNLSVSGLPNGATGSFSANPVTPAANGSASSTLSVSVPASTNLGTWTVTVTGTSGTHTHSATFNISVVQPVPADFSLGAAPTSLALTQGATASDTITVTSSNSFANAVSLAVSGLPSGVTATFAPTSVTPPANGSATSTLSLSATAAAATGSATVTVTGVSGSLTHSATFTLTVNPSSNNVLQNGVPVTGLSGAKGAQLKYTVNIPAGASNLVIATSGGTGDEDLYVKFGSAPTTSSYDCRPYVSGNAEICTFASPQVGTYYVMLNGYAAFSGVTLKATWTVSTPDFGIAAAPASLSVNVCSNGSSTITVNSLGGFASAVNLSTGTLPYGVTANFGTNPVTPAANGSASSSLNFAVSCAAQQYAGTYNITVTGVSGSTSHSASISLTLVPLDSSQQLLLNTGFETTGSWTATSGVLCTTGCSGESAHAGSGFAWLDGYGSTHTDTLAQTVAIPSGKSSAVLQYYLHVDTSESGSTALDTLNVQVLNSSGAQIANLGTFSNLDAASGYVVHTANLNAYIGQTITIKFVGAENSSNQTSFVLDDVTLTVQ